MVVVLAKHVIKSIITWAGRYYLVKGGQYNFCNQGGIMSLMPPMGGIMGLMPPMGGIKNIITPP